jgi:hypothetical protein
MDHVLLCAVAKWHCGQNEAGYWQIQNLSPHCKQKKKGDSVCLPRKRW